MSSIIMGIGVFMVFTGVLLVRILTIWIVGFYFFVIGLLLITLGGQYENRKKLRK